MFRTEIFTCARTKSEAIVVNVLTPTAMKELRDDLVSQILCNDASNQGGAATRGTNNVLTRLQSSLKKPLIGIGCRAHVIPNAIKSTADGLDYTRAFGDGPRNFEPWPSDVDDNCELTPPLLTTTPRQREVT
ncbi:hypothetical protein TNCV_1865861 [Trichonephila clavipes]|nr:hypothetical protein TNCV_1865861 [Trichonephila clavipes]